MYLTHKIKIYLDDKRMLPPINVMQGDANARKLELSLYASGKEWMVPDGTSVAVAYSGSSGRGIYDTLPDGAKAYIVDGHVVTVTLIPQVTAKHGVTTISVVFTDNSGRQLATFGVEVKVDYNPAEGAGEPANYYNLREWVSTPLHVHIFEIAAENYVADQDYGIIQQEYEAGRQVVCSLEMDDRQWLELPLVKATNGVFEFGGIVSDTGWKALISRGEDGAAIVEVTSSVYGGPPVYVTMTGTEATGYQADCTYEMIKAAHEAKRTVYCVYNTTIMILAAVTESMVAFQTMYSKSTYRRAFIYADASQPPKTDMMKFVLAEDLEGKADLPKPTDEIYFDITDEGVLSLKPEYRGAYSGTSASSAPYWSDNGGKRDGTFNKELPEEIILPEDVDGVNVTALAAHMFHGNKRVKRIVLPSCIDAIPEGFCNAAVNLEEVANTEHIKTLGSHAFNTTSIRKAYFPGLIELPKRSNGNAATSHFANCANLVSADLGQVFTQPGAVIPAYCFSGCERLVRLQNAGGVTSIGDFGLYMTRRMKNPDFLPADQPHLCKLTSIGNYGLLLSRVNFDWNALPADAFGALSTPKQINTTDYSGCKFTARTNPLRSTFEQHDPRWANKNIGNCANTYSTGCATVAAAMIYSALMEVDMGSPEEFVAAVDAVDESLLDLDIANGTNDVTGGGDFWGELVRWFDAAGLKAVVYNSVSAANVQVMYDALANGALVWGRILADYNNENHCVVIHGVNGAGELLVTDSSAASRYIGVYEAATYTMPVRNFMRDHGDYVDHFLIVTKK